MFVFSFAVKSTQTNSSSMSCYSFHLPCARGGCDVRNPPQWPCFDSSPLSSSAHFS
ncbi:hypothetical protein Bca4012_003315 [Brassica carinata]